MKKCSFGKGITIKPDGVNELDPCTYKTIARYRNVTVTIMECTECGHVELSWQWQENTEDATDE